MSEGVGAVKTLWRFPVKSMRGEQLDAADVTEAGLVGDRAYALVDTETGKVLSGKTPRLGSRLLGCRAAFVEPPSWAPSTYRCASRCRTGLRSGATLLMLMAASRVSWDAP
jgi:MOSC N-terminal beta barrel domain